LPLATFVAKSYTPNPSSVVSTNRELAAAFGSANPPPACGVRLFVADEEREAAAV
jgi:hypothetical protein